MKARIKINDIVLSQKPMREPKKDDEGYINLMEIIKKEGIRNDITVPIVLDNRNHLIDGLMRIRICQDLGIDEVDCLIL